MKNLPLYSHSVNVFMFLINRFYANVKTVLHPYYKLAYIKMAWGGPEEQAAERASGNADAKDWHDEALKIVEWTAEEYWRKRQKALMPRERTPVSDSNDGGDKLSPKSAFDLLRQRLITRDGDEGWAAELRRYLKDMPADVTRDTDILEWWSVCDAAPVFIVSLVYHSIGESKALPNVGTHCLGCPGCAGFICALRAPLF